MKSKMLLSFAIIIFSTFALQAQIEKKDWLLGGTLGFNTSNSNSSNNSNSNTNFAPHIGYAVGKNSVIGLNAEINYSQSAQESKNFSFSTNAFYKKFFQVKGKFGTYLQFNGGVGWNASSFLLFDSAGTSSKQTSSNHFYSASIVPGVYYQVSPGILLNADCGGLSYSYTTSPDGYWYSNFVIKFPEKLHIWC